MDKHKTQFGFTLLETLLVLVIISSVLLVGLNYQIQKTEAAHRDKMVMQYEIILNAGMAYYVNTGTWPTSLTVLQSNGYLPNTTTVTNNVFGNPYIVTSSNNLLYVYSQVPSGTAVNFAQASTIAGAIPFGYTSTSPNSPPDPTLPCQSNSNLCNVVASVPVPGQNLNNARSVNFANLYHDGGCVPAPICPSGMTPEIFVVPVSVSGFYSNTQASAGYPTVPVLGFTAVAYGAPSPPNRPGSQPTTPDNVAGCINPANAVPCEESTFPTVSISGSATQANGQYWRVCVNVQTERGDIYHNIEGNSPIYLNNISALAITRCSPANEGVGSDFTVYTGGP